MHKKLLCPHDNKSAAPKLVSLSITKDDGDLPSLFHSHPGCEIMFVVCDGGVLKTPNKDLPLLRHNLLIVNPNVQHAEIPARNKALEYYVANCEGVIFSKNKRPSFDDGSETAEDVIRIETTAGDGNRFLDLFGRIYEELQNNLPNASIMASCYLNILITEIVRRYSMLPVSHMKNSFTSPVAYIREYIDAHYSASFKIEEFAEKLSISYSALRHRFKKEIGVSPVEYRLLKQLEIAKHLLQNSDSGVTQICAIIGFSNAAYFSKIFKQRYGMTPKEFRVHNK